MKCGARKSRCGRLALLRETKTSGWRKKKKVHKCWVLGTLIGFKWVWGPRETHGRHEESESVFCVVLLVHPSTPSSPSPQKEALYCDCVCVCSSHLVWESAGKHQCVSFLLFCPTPLPIPSAPASLTCLPPPLTLSSSPLDQTIHFSGHMESVQSSLMLLLLLLVWVQNAVASLPI